MRKRKKEIDLMRYVRKGKPRDEKHTHTHTQTHTHTHTHTKTTNSAEGLEAPPKYK